MSKQIPARRQHQSRPSPILCVALFAAALAHSSAGASAANGLAFTDASRFALSGPYSAARVLTERAGPGQTVHDATAQAHLSVADPSVAELDGDMIRPRRDGVTRIVARLGAYSVSAPVVVTGMAKPRAPRFLTDVMPVITHAGCNQGACHGAGSGKGGFKLSLLGYDPDTDYETITRGSGARRVDAASPENSLLLLKPTFRVRHRGGHLFDPGSPAYRVLRDWISAGMPGPKPTEPGVARVEVVPAVRTLAMNETQAYSVRAHYTDGTVRDVTAEAVFKPSDASVAAVAPDGRARVTGMGEAATLVRYRALVATARVISPFARPYPAQQTRQETAAEHIDALVSAKLAALGLHASPRCTDSDFLRRAYLDAIGLLPTPDEARTFLADRRPDRRARLVESLLTRPEYVDYWTLQWGDLLRCSREQVTDRGMNALHAWIRRCVSENRSWDKMTRELLLARGSAYSSGPANFFRAAETPGQLGETTSQVFLGVHMECARCHNHPYEKWTQTQYYQLASFFARVHSEPGQMDQEKLICVSDSGDVRHPRTNAVVQPAALDAAPLPASYSGDRREALAEWVTSPQNPFFGHSIVNRMWRHFMGRGLVEPVDDLRVTNPPSNAPLFDWLAADFVRNGYDLKRLAKVIMSTEAYQRSAEAMPASRRDTRYYSHFLLKRLGAEQLLDSLAAATGVPQKFDGYPEGLRACQLPDSTAPSYFLDLFGRPERKTTCACERSDAPTIAQVLHFMNGKEINDRLTAAAGRAATVSGAKVAPQTAVENLYLATVSRFPTAAESRKAAIVISSAKDRRKGAEDLLWALLNTNEFLFNH